MTDTTDNTPQDTENEDFMTDDATEENGAAEDIPTGRDDIIFKLNAELEATRDRLLRSVAEADNTRKRAEKEVRDAREYSVSKFAEDMLDVSDSLSRAVAAVDDETIANASESMKNLIEGVAMTERAMLAKMERHGVRKVEPQPGDVFDPHMHQAVAQIPSDQPAGKIAAVMQTGFTISGRTLRAAMVAVSAGQGSDDAPLGGEPGGHVDMKA
jgi:molecular chaperone GrpE